MSPTEAPALACMAEMFNTIRIHGHRAVISLVPEQGLLRGEFVELNGGADFPA
jgi:predicted HicB family RNase H-like nuclease